MKLLDRYNTIDPNTNEEDYMLKEDFKDIILKSDNLVLIGRDNIKINYNFKVNNDLLIFCAKADNETFDITIDNPQDIVDAIAESTYSFSELDTNKTITSLKNEAKIKFSTAFDNVIPVDTKLNYKGKIIKDNKTLAIVENVKLTLLSSDRVGIISCDIIRCEEIDLKDSTMYVLLPNNKYFSAKSNRTQITQDTHFELENIQFYVSDNGFEIINEKANFEIEDIEYNTISESSIGNLYQKRLPLLIDTQNTTEIFSDMFSELLD